MAMIDPYVNRRGCVVSAMLAVAVMAMPACESAPRGSASAPVPAPDSASSPGSGAFVLGTVRRTETYDAKTGETETAVQLQYRVRATRLTPDSAQIVRGQVLWLEGRDEQGQTVFDLGDGPDSPRRRLDTILPLLRLPMGTNLDGVGRGTNSNVRARIVEALPGRVELVGELAVPVYSEIETRDVTIDEMIAGVRVAPNLYIGGADRSEAPALERRYRVELLIPAGAERAYWALEPVETTLLLSVDALTADGAVLGEIPGAGGSSGKSRVRREFTLNRVQTPAGAKLGGVRLTYARRLDWRVEGFRVGSVPLRGGE